MKAKNPTNFYTPQTTTLPILLLLYMIYIKCLFCSGNVAQLASQLHTLFFLPCPPLALEKKMIPLEDYYTFFLHPSRVFGQN